MNYMKIYSRLVARAQGRQFDGYGENHHIVPKCLGGTDDIGNLVKLTAEEHFVAHLLLAKVYPAVRYLSVAVILMRGRKTKTYVKNSKFYAKLRAKAAEASKRENRSAETLQKLADAARNMSQEQRDKIASSLKGRKASDEAKAKIAAAGLGRKHSEESKLKMRGPREESAETKARRSAAKTGFKHSEEARAKMTASHLVRAPMTEETKRKIGEASKGRKLSQEHKDNISKSNKGKPSPLKGLQRSEEDRRKMSEGRKGKRIPQESIDRMKLTKARNHFLYSSKTGLLTHWIAI